MLSQTEENERILSDMDPSIELIQNYFGDKIWLDLKVKSKEDFINKCNGTKLYDIIASNPDEPDLLRNYPGCPGSLTDSLVKYKKKNPNFKFMESLGSKISSLQLSQYYPGVSFHQTLIDAKQLYEEMGPMTKKELNADVRQTLESIKALNEVNISQTINLIKNWGAKLIEHSLEQVQLTKKNTLDNLIHVCLVGEIAIVTDMALGLFRSTLETILDKAGGSSFSSNRYIKNKDEFIGWYNSLVESLSHHENLENVLLSSPMCLFINVIMDTFVLNPAMTEHFNKLLGTHTTFFSNFHLSKDSKEDYKIIFYILLNRLKTTMVLDNEIEFDKFIQIMKSAIPLKNHKHADYKHHKHLNMKIPKWINFNNSSLPSMIKKEKRKIDVGVHSGYREAITNFFLTGKFNDSQYKPEFINPKPTGNYIDTSSKKYYYATGLNWYYKCSKYVNVINSTLLDIDYDGIVLLKADRKRFGINSHVIIFTNSDPGIITNKYLPLKMSSMRNRMTSKTVSVILSSLMVDLSIGMKKVSEEVVKVTQDLRFRLTKYCGYDVDKIGLVGADQSMEKTIEQLITGFIEGSEKTKLKDSISSIMSDPRMREELGDSFSLPYKWGRILNELPPVNKRRILQDQQVIGELNSICPDIDLLSISGRLKVGQVFYDSIISQVTLMTKLNQKSADSDLLSSMHILNSIMADCVITKKGRIKTVEDNILDYTTILMKRTLSKQDQKVKIYKPSSAFKKKYW
jgi:hypothetical protein